jgi:hypothetical protein
VAEILAKARGSEAAPSPPTEEPTADQKALAENATTPEETTTQTESPPDESASTDALPTTTAEKISWCRQHDAQ